MNLSERQEEASSCPNHRDANWVEDPYYQRIHDVTAELFYILDAPHPEEDCLDLINARESLVLVSQRLMNRQMRQDPYVAWLNGEIQGSAAQIEMWAQRSPWSKATIIRVTDLKSDGEESGDKGAV